MAKATRQTTLLPPPPPETTITLVLSQDEADMIRMLVGNVGGRSRQRLITQAIYDALHDITNHRRDFWPVGNTNFPDEKE